MSYQVLARKWRPAVLKDLIGQDFVVQILSNALKNKRLHPALIFAGPRGTGKTSTARILAKSLSCPQVKDSILSCNNCKTCEDIDGSRSLDVMEIDGASNNGVEAVRQLKETITYLPASGPYRIYIIDEVHMLSVSAFNALLKTLEEPPSHALFIMATTEMRKIPSTVLSRCQILQFHQIADHLVYEQLKNICEKEKVQTEDSAIWMLVRESQGSLRDAQGLLDQMITFCDKSFNSEDVSTVLGLTDRSLLMQTLKSLLERRPDQIIKVLDQLQIKGGDPVLFLQNLIKEMRNLLLLKISTSQSIKHLIPLSQEEKTTLLEWTKPVSYEDLHMLLDMTLKGSWEIGRVQDSKIFLEMLLLKMSQAPYIEDLVGGNPIQPEEQEKSKPVEEHSDTQKPEKQKQTREPQPENQKQKSKDVKNHLFVQQIQNIFDADILDSKDL
jgi:DNA polymerase-3 subunit gamma/tau